MWPATDERQVGQVACECIRGLRVQRLHMQADKIRRKRADAFADLGMTLRRERCRCVEQGDFVPTGAQRCREMTERQQWRLHRLR